MFGSLFYQLYIYTNHGTGTVNRDCMEKFLRHSAELYTAWRDANQYTINFVAIVIFAAAAVFAFIDMYKNDYNNEHEY